MPVENETVVGPSPKASYFALIPVFRYRRNKGRVERRIVKIIHESDICKSSPILKALLIENVRICCIMIESSGKQSVRILCASAPYLLAVISRANPKFERLLKNEKVVTCLKKLKESDLEPLLNSVYHMTVSIHSGVTKLYFAFHVNYFKDLIPLNQQSLLYVLNSVLYVLQTCAKFICDNVGAFIRQACLKNYKFASYIAENSSYLIAAVVKYSILATASLQKSVILSVKYAKKIVHCMIQVLNHFHSDSLFCMWLKKAHVILTFALSQLRSTHSYKNLEPVILNLITVVRSYVWKYLVNIMNALKTFVTASIPVIKRTFRSVIDESVPALQKFMDDNLESFLELCSKTSTFLHKNSHHIKSFCCHTCQFCYSSVVKLHHILQKYLPRVIQLSSNTVDLIMNFSRYILEYCGHLCKLMSSHIIPAFESQKRFICRLPRAALKILKAVYGIILKLQPYMVQLVLITLKQLTKAIRESSPTVLTCFRELNSTAFYASKEVIAKSCLAVKRMTPSFYYSVKIVVPPTVLAVLEMIKTSRDSVSIITPAILKCVLVVHPDIKEGVVVLITDGNKACLEIISVSYSATRELKDVAKTVSSNIPVFCGAAREVLLTTTYAAVGISTTSLNAKSRVLKDIKKARKGLCTSLMLAEQEIVSVYTDLAFEFRSVSLRPPNILLYQRNAVNSCLIKSFYSLYNIVLEKIFNVLCDLRKNFSIAILTTSKAFINLFYDLCISAYVAIIAALIPAERASKVDSLNQYLFRHLQRIFIAICKDFSSRTQHVWQFARENWSANKARLVQSIVCGVSEMWYAYKSGAKVIWNEICVLSPEIWIAFEQIAEVIWNFSVENIPGAWKAWKSLCFTTWKISSTLAPYFWCSLTSAVAASWSSGRELTKQTWIMSVSSASFTWHQSMSFTSEYWLLCKTYVPPVWFTGCETTRRGWNVSCFFIENCWNLTVETCSFSWSFLHHTVSKSWRSGVVCTKSAYYMIVTTGSVLQKSFCACTKTKNYVCVLFEVRPGLGESRSPLNSFHTPTLKQDSQCDTHETLQSSEDSPDRSSYMNTVRNCIFAVIHPLSRASVLLSYAKLIILAKLN